MAEQSAGEITYTVDMETAALIKSTDKTDESLDRLQRGFDKTDGAAKGMRSSQNKLATAVKKANSEISGQSSAFSSLAKVISGLLALKALQNAIDLADQYTDMASRIRNATSSTEEYEAVQARLLKTANGTYRSLAEAQEVYLSTADTLRDLGYQTKEVLDITDSMSYAFVRDAARKDQATSAMDAYSKALMKGKIDADAWASILAATPSIVNGIAEATNESTMTIKRLGAQGKLSTEALNEGFRRSLDVNKQYADQMDTTARDSFVQLQNSLQVFIGKVNESSGATGHLASAVGEVATILQDPATIQAAQNLAAGIVNAFGGIVRGAKEVVEFTQWMAEEVAARINGINIDDTVRLEQLLDDLKAQQDKGFFTRAFNYRDDEKLAATILQTERQLAEAYKRQEEAAAAAMRQSSANSKAKESESKSTEQLNTVSAEAVSLTNKKSEADKEAEKAARDKASAEERNAAVVKNLADQLMLASFAGAELAEKKALLSLNSYARPEEVEEVKRLTAALYEQADAAKLKNSAGKLDAAVGAQSTFDEEMAELKRLNEAKIIEDQRYLELKTQMETAHAENMRRIEEERFAAQSRANQLLIDSLNEMQSAGTNAITGLLAGTNSLTDAMQQLGDGIVRHAVDALVEMGVQHVKSIVMGQMAEKAAAASSIATAASTGAAITASYAPAAAAASVATMGGAATAGYSAMAAAVPAMIGTLAGGRLHGGPVSADGMYRINENGRPEVFNAANGQQFMLPNTRGEVVSNRNATGGGASVMNNITITVASDGSVESTSNGSDPANAEALAQGIRVVVVDEIERQSRPGGSLWSMQQNGRSF